MLFTFFGFRSVLWNQCCEYRLRNSAKRRESVSFPVNSSSAMWRLTQYSPISWYAWRISLGTLWNITFIITSCFLIRFIDFHIDQCFAFEFPFVPATTIKLKIFSLANMAPIIAGNSPKRRVTSGSSSNENKRWLLRQRIFDWNIFHIFTTLVLLDVF